MSINTYLVTSGLLCLFSVVFCEELQQPLRFQRIKINMPRIRRTFKSLNVNTPEDSISWPYHQTPFPQHQNSALGLVPISDQAAVSTVTRTPRNYLRILYPASMPMPNLIPLRRYRTLTQPSSTEPAVEGRDDILEPNSEKLRFFGWLFSRYPNYSALEHAAGLPGYGSRFPTMHREPSVIVEDCVEYLDAHTHSIFEECEEVPYH